ncbi:MAG TPA: hypothetical protein VF837_01725 [Patescibacteria group bacterium]
MRNRSENGQIALILVLIMTVIATATVALSARTTVETRVQEINVDSSQAMLAAESGLEQALRNAPNANLTGTIDANTSFTATNQTVSTNQNAFQGIKRGETVEIFTTGSVAPTTLTLLWQPVGNDPSFTPRGVFVSVYDSSGKITDYAYDTVGNASIGFGLADASGVPGYTYSKDIPVTATTTKVDITALGGDIDLGVRANGWTLPAQLNEKQVVGTVTRVGTGNTTETVKYGLDYRQSINGEVPEVFEYALFSGQSISQ